MSDLSRLESKAKELVNRDHTFIANLIGPLFSHLVQEPGII